MAKSFYVRALWDDEVKRYYSDSDIHGLNIETDTIEEFEEVLKDVAIDLVFANHVSPEELASTPLKDLTASHSLGTSEQGRRLMVKGFYLALTKELNAPGFVHTTNAKGSHEKWVRGR